MEPNTIHVRGFKIRSLAQVCIILCGILLLITYWSIAQVNQNYQNLIESTNDCVQGERCALMLERSSDYLTEQVRLFVLGQDLTYVHNYFAEVNAGTREAMVEQLRQIYGDNDPNSVEQLRDALDRSRALEEKEIHAMRLTALRMNIDTERLPARLVQWPLTAEELAMTDYELEMAAYELVYGFDYLKEKQRIEDSTQRTLNLLADKTKQRQRESAQALQETFIKQRFYTFLMMLLVMVVFFLVGVLIIHPISEQIRAIRANKRWRPIGGYEMRYLASVYNRLYDRNEVYRERLEYRARHDALTGIFNRETFEYQKEQLRGKKRPLALMLVDVDEFKQVNDTLGHEAGDDALRRVANELQNMTLEKEYIAARIGGDEFAVLIYDAGEEIAPQVGEIVRGINETMRQVQAGTLRISVSAGIAFSQEGYTDLLFRRADLALYHTKRNGRCGISAYRPEMERGAQQQRRT